MNLKFQRKTAELMMPILHTVQAVIRSKGKTRIKQSKDVVVMASWLLIGSFICRVNMQKLKSQSRSGMLHQQKMHHPNFHHRDRYDVPVTPCTSRKPPNHNGNMQLNSAVFHSCVTIKLGLNCIAALNATVAVQRVRSKHSEENKEETSSLVSQVLNPEPLLRQSGNYFWQLKYLFLNCRH